jgi:hypothetical protein
MKTTTLICALIVMLTGCSMPATTVKTVDSRPSISIVGASDDAMLLVDGILVGKASSYNGQPNVLVLEPGTHRVVVQQNGTTSYDQKIFVDSETKQINIR